MLFAVDFIVTNSKWWCRVCNSLELQVSNLEQKSEENRQFSNTLRVELDSLSHSAVNQSHGIIYSMLSCLCETLTAANT